MEKTKEQEYREANDPAMKDEQDEQAGRCKCRYRPDCMLWGVGILFIAVIIAVMFGLGIWREWDAPSGWTHNETLTSQQRFLPEPVDNDPYPHVKGRSGAGASGSWYYWKSKPEAVTVWSRLFVWLSYSTHQLAIWVVLYLAQAHKEKYGGPRASTSLSKYNWISFAINAFYHVLHMVNTHVTYDGLAQDVTVTSSQCSVIMLLLLIVLLEYNERGLFFGWPVARLHKGNVSKKLTLNMQPTRLVRKYHGYAFAWAAIYTFWYHPMENTYGHAMGFFHTWAIMLQGSLMFTSVHTNRWWRLLLQSWVTLHGCLVAIQTGKPNSPGESLWPMFTFGFLMLFCFTQIYLLPFWLKIPSWAKVFPPLVYIAVVLGAYSVIPDINGRYWVRLQEIIRIPAIVYLGVLIVWAFMYLCVYLDKKIYAKCSKEPTTASRALSLTFSLLIFVFFVALSLILHSLTSSVVSFFILMVILVFVFSLFSGLAIVMLSHSMPKRIVHIATDYTNEGYKVEEKVDADGIHPQVQEHESVTSKM